MIRFLKTFGYAAVCMFIIPKSVSADVSNGLIAHYTFEGNAKDVIGNDINGREYGGVTYVKGVDGAAARFKGIDGFIEVPSSESLKPHRNFSVSLWVNVEDFRNKWSPIIHKGGRS